ncbi:cytochrome P450 [Streptomyces sp. NPDC006658]|uniref:cytochrome P450 n=1 Tax=Streptomyces sp. NPDC006658 TaxID=3156900 RepID=UPI003407866E
MEEFLRYAPSVERSTSRYAARDLGLGGVAIPRGSMIAVALGSTGRDARNRAAAARPCRT